MKIVFGENLKTFRRKLGLSQSELAKMLTEAGKAYGINVAYKNISKWENGNVCPDAPLLIHIAKVLDTTIDFLLTGKDPTRELLLENESLKGIKRFIDEHVSYVVKNNDLHLRINEPAKYSNIEFSLWGLIYGKKQEIGNKNITDDIFFGEVIIKIPNGADNFALKCRQIDEPDKPQSTIITKAYSLMFCMSIFSSDIC